MPDTYDDNIEEVMAWYDRNSPDRSVHRMIMANVMEYARPLNAKDGLYVFNDDKTLEIVHSWLRDLALSGQPLNDKNIELALEGAGFEIIDFLTSLTGKLKPGIRSEHGDREKHPGGWADVTRNLANAYRFVINEGRSKAPSPNVGPPTEPRTELTI